MGNLFQKIKDRWPQIRYDADYFFKIKRGKIYAYVGVVVLFAVVFGMIYGYYLPFPEEPEDYERGRYRDAGKGTVSGILGTEPPAYKVEPREIPVDMSQTGEGWHGEGGAESGELKGVPREGAETPPVSDASAYPQSDEEIKAHVIDSYRRAYGGNYMREIKKDMLRDKLKMDSKEYYEEWKYFGDLESSFEDKEEYKELIEEIEREGDRR